VAHRAGGEGAVAGQPGRLGDDQDGAARPTGRRGLRQLGAIVLAAASVLDRMTRLGMPVSRRTA
jgi:hypothetical protein